MLPTHKSVLSALSGLAVVWVLSVQIVQAETDTSTVISEEQPILLEEPAPAEAADGAEESPLPETEAPSVDTETAPTSEAAAPETPVEEATSGESSEKAPEPAPSESVESEAEKKRESAAGAIESARGTLEEEEVLVLASEEPTVRPPFELLGASVPPATIRHLGWKAESGYGVLDEPTPVLVVHGAEEGPVLCLTAAVHGDEINGIDVVRRIVHGLDPKELKGTVVGVPIVNLPGFRRGSRYLPDRRDLNRFFPGHPKGSLASRIAHSFFKNIIQDGCHILVDVHTGSFHRSNLPQLRADLRDSTVADMAHGFGEIAVLQSNGARGTLRRVATEKGIPAVTLETGEPLRLQPSEVAQAVKGIESLMSHLGMTKGRRLWRNPQPIYYDSRWVRSQRGGILFSKVKLGDSVRVGDVLGTVTDPLTNKSESIIAPHNGRILGRALNQFVMPGFAAFHMGIESSQEELVSESGTSSEISDEEQIEILEGDRPDRASDE